MEKEKYFNFPIWLLKGAFSNMNKVCKDIIEFAIFKHAKDLQGTPQKRINDSAKFFEVVLGRPSGTFENGQLLFKSTPAKSAMTGISKTLAFEYYSNTKTDKEIAVLLAFLAIKSILGQKPYCRITSEFLICRMAGFTSIKEMSEIPSTLKKYETRYHMDCLKYELRNSFGLKIYGRYTYGFFVSFKLTEEQLILAVESKRKKAVLKRQRESQRNTLKKVLHELYSDNTNTTPITEQ